MEGEGGGGWKMFLAKSKQIMTRELANTTCLKKKVANYYEFLFLNKLKYFYTVHAHTQLNGMVRMTPKSPRQMRSPS